MFTTLSAWLYILFTGMQFSCNNATTTILPTWIEQTFPKKITHEDDLLFKTDNITGCKILLCPRINNYIVYSDACSQIPTDVEIYGDELFIKTTKITKIYAGDFDNWPQLLSLNIEMNSELMEIEPGAFNILTHLNNLSISNNYKLKTIEPELFVGLLKLKELKFIQNNMHQLSEFILSLNPATLPSLTTLDISQNPFDKIKSIDFIALNNTKIEILNLKFCGLYEIDADSFSTLTELRELDLSNNNLNTHILSKLILNLTQTSVNFTKLNLAGNLLNKDPMKLFQTISLTNITELIVKDNHFDLLQPKLFPVMTKLRKLDLSNLMAIDIDKNIFNEKFFPNLASLIFAKNSFPGILKNMLLPNLIELDLSENSCDNCFTTTLFKINELIFDDMDKLRILNLARNALYHIQLFTFYGLNNLEILNLSNCTIYFIDDYSFVNLTNLKQLDLSYNKFLVNYSINPKTFYGLDNLEMLKLHNCELNSNVDPYLFSHMPNLKYLTLRENALTYIKHLWFQNLTKLTELDLAYNYIGEWSIYKKFVNNNHLTVLSLFSNRIRTLTEFMLADLQNLQYLDLRENQFDCSCQIVFNVRQFLLDKNISLNLLPINFTKNKCFSPKQLSDLELTVFLETHIEKNLCDNIQLALIIFLCFVALVLLSISALLIYYLRWHIRYWIFLLRQAMRYNYFPSNNKSNTKDSKYKYDAFVSYSHEDRNFVVRLVAMLESQPPYFKLCVFERDFNVGNIITESVLECLTSSRRTILVLSDSFARSTWCLWEMQLAQHKRLFFKDEQIEPLVIVKIGEIMDRHMTPTLRYLIKSRVYLQWNPDPIKQKLFWQKLREALAPPKVQV